MLRGNLIIWTNKKRNEFNFLKEEVEEVGQESKSLDSENRKLIN